MKKSTRIIIALLVCWGVLPFVAVPVYRLFADKSAADRTATADNGREESAQYYDKPFSGSFSVKVSPDKDAYNKKRFVFYTNGTAVLQHDNNHKAVYEFYTYEPQGDKIELHGDNVVTSGASGVRVRQGRPDDITLHVSAGDGDVAMSGTDDGGGRSYSLTPAGNAGYGNISAHAFDAVDFCKSSFAADPERLWVVKADRTGAATGKNSDRNYRYFSKGELLSGSPDPDDKAYIRLPYAAGRWAYVGADDVEHVGTPGRLAELLAEDGLRGTSLLQWTKTFPDISRRLATKGYFNGWRAGRLSSMFFLVAAVVMAVIAFLRYMYYWDGRSWIIVSKAVLFAVTLMELWYAWSLGPDMFWFITDENPIVAAINIVLMSLVLGAHFILLSMAFADAVEYNNSYSSVPKWVEYVLAVVFCVLAFGALAHGYVSSKYWLVVFYAALMLAALPTIISIKQHSCGRCNIVLFMLVCYPMRLLLLVFLIIFEILGKIRSSDTEEDKYVRVRDAFGNEKLLRRDSGNEYYDNSGRRYSHNISGYIPTDNSNEGPYN